MKREIIKTGDGSATIFLPDWNEHYHSKHGAVQEALHVFIECGLQYYTNKQESQEISILEIGFGTGLNVLLTYYYAKKNQLSVSYTGVEAYPVARKELQLLNYYEVVREEGASEVFQKLHQLPWEKLGPISPFFSLQKEKKFFSEISAEDQFDIVFFDAFGPRVQPELWGEEVFQKMFTALKEEGVLVTYSAKGSVRRAMQTVGFKVERLPGPPGKREMLRATKALGEGC